MSLILLGVNIDHIATLRQVRGTSYPNLIEAAAMAVSAGADSITLHLREDRRHIQDSDVTAMKSMLTVPMNLELAITDEMLDIAGNIRPQFCCFVPERREELTTEGGLDVVANSDRVRQACDSMKHAGTRVSLFIDADSDQIQAAAECGAQVIEIHTGPYADAIDITTREYELHKITNVTTLAVGLGLQVNAGHGLNYDNIHSIAAIKDIHELNIGHAIVARAVFSGLGKAVSDMKMLIKQART